MAMFKALPKISVVVRKRPMTKSEIENGECDLIKQKDAQTFILEEPKEKVDRTPYILRHEFRVDRAFDDQITNPQIFSICVKPLVKAAFEENARCSCFAYGQTGSGKTFTMLGPQPYGQANHRELRQAGVFELAAEELFEHLDKQDDEKPPKPPPATASASPSMTHHKRYAFISFFEIYNGKLFDLLQKRRLVAALENGKKEVIVRDLKVEKVTSKEELVGKMIDGLDLRQIGANSVNDESSRSHAILQIDLKRDIESETLGKIAFIDLAGSERGADTFFHSKQTHQRTPLSAGAQMFYTFRQDGAGINRSLLALKECIRAMDQEKGHIPFRDSELTKVLRDIFIGKSRSVMIANIAPSLSCCEQTLNTLRYAARVKNFRLSKSGEGMCYDDGVPANSLSISTTLEDMDDPASDIFNSNNMMTPRPIENELSNQSRKTITKRQGGARSIVNTGGLSNTSRTQLHVSSKRPSTTSRASASASGANRRPSSSILACGSGSGSLTGGGGGGRPSSKLKLRKAKTTSNLQFSATMRAGSLLASQARSSSNGDALTGGASSDGGCDEEKEKEKDGKRVRLSKAGSKVGHGNGGQSAAAQAAEAASRAFRAHRQAASEAARKAAAEREVMSSTISTGNNLATTDTFIQESCDNVGVDPYCPTSSNSTQNDAVLKNVGMDQHCHDKLYYPHAELRKSPDRVDDSLNVVIVGKRGLQSRSLQEAGRQCEDESYHTASSRAHSPATERIDGELSPLCLNSPNTDEVHPSSPSTFPFSHSDAPKPPPCTSPVMGEDPQEHKRCSQSHSQSQSEQSRLGSGNCISSPEAECVGGTSDKSSDSGLSEARMGLRDSDNNAGTSNGNDDSCSVGSGASDETSPSRIRKDRGRETFSIIGQWASRVWKPRSSSNSLIRGVCDSFENETDREQEMKQEVQEPISGDSGDDWDESRNQCAQQRQCKGEAQYEVHNQRLQMQHGRDSGQIKPNEEKTNGDFDSSGVCGIGDRIGRTGGNNQADVDDETRDALSPISMGKRHHPLNGETLEGGCNVSPGCTSFGFTVAVRGGRGGKAGGGLGKKSGLQNPANNARKIHHTIVPDHTIYVPENPSLHRTHRENDGDSCGRVYGSSITSGSGISCGSDGSNYPLSPTNPGSPTASTLRQHTNFHQRTEYTQISSTSPLPRIEQQPFPIPSSPRSPMRDNFDDRHPSNFDSNYNTNHRWNAQQNSSSNPPARVDTYGTQDRGTSGSSGGRIGLTPENADDEIVLDQSSQHLLKTFIPPTVRTIDAHQLLQKLVKKGLGTMGGGDDPGTIARPDDVALDYRRLDLVELDQLTTSVYQLRNRKLQSLLTYTQTHAAKQLGRESDNSRVDDSSTRCDTGVGNVATGGSQLENDLMMCKLHQHNPGVEFSSFIRQRMEKEMAGLIRMRQLWMDAEDLRLLHRFLVAYYQDRSASAIKFGGTNISGSHIGDSMITASQGGRESNYLSSTSSSVVHEATSGRFPSPISPQVSPLPLASSPPGGLSSSSRQRSSTHALPQSPLHLSTSSSMSSQSASTSTSPYSPMYKSP